MGEDFKFYAGLMAKYGHERLILVPDSCGLCLHLQHTYNTSDTHCVAIREVPWLEVSDLDVADLYPVFDRYLMSLRDKGGETRELSQSAGADDAPRRSRDITAHTPFGDLQLYCPVGAAAADVLERIETHTGVLPLTTDMFWLPPQLVDHAHAMPEFQAGVLQVMRLVSPCTSVSGMRRAAADSDWSDVQKRMFRRVTSAIPWHARVGGQVAEVWLSVRLADGQGIASVSAECGMDACRYRSSPYVRVTCADDPAPESVSSIFHVDLPLDADVALLRCALSPGFFRLG